MSDDLSSPLGKKQPPKWRQKLAALDFDLPIGRILFGVIGLIVAGVAFRLVSVDDPGGGQPIVVVPIESTRNSNTVAQQVSSPQERTHTIVTDDSQQPVVEQTAPPAEMAPADTDQVNEFGVYPSLSEQTQNGPIPRIGANGQTPFAAYARPSVGPETAAAQPVIAIIVTGMGLNEEGTLQAISTLPDNVTLAFAPYSRSLQSTTSAARAGGHELMLEVPMEPFDYPDSDPGPHTLLSDNPPRTNLDRLFWLMARMGGYVGIINNMGARFTASAAALGPIMEELGTRGLGMVDDASSNRSLTRQLALSNQVPFARADLLLDENPSRSAILASLSKLEEIARTEGRALGIISALPVSISTLSTWASQLEEQGILLVPASVVMGN